MQKLFDIKSCLESNDFRWNILKILVEYLLFRECDTKKILKNY